ncbi:MAG: SRPBCC family protein [Myxococcota bacterium]
MSSNTVAVARTVRADAGAIWDIVRTGRDVDRYLPDLIRSCRVDGAGTGARRVCGTDAGPIEETVLTVDDGARLFRYRIDAQPLMPLTDYVGALHVADLGDGRAEVLWFASFEPTDPASAPAIADSLSGLFTSGIGALATLAGGAA